MNPTDPKYKSIKTANKTLQDQLFSVRGMEQLLIALGFEDQGEYFVYTSADLRPIVPFASFLVSAKEKVKERSLTPKQLQEKREKERRIAEEKAAFEKAKQEKQRLEQQFKNDMAEKKDNKVTQSSVAVKRNFGSEAKGFKEIGVDLNKQRRG
jgi:PUB domain